MHVGIIIPAFNVAPWLPKAIESVLRQTSTDWSMMVVDDGSTDATAAAVDSFPDHRIRLIRQPNAGVSAARNRGLAAIQADGLAAIQADGLAAIQADAVLFLDGDDWLAPDALAELSEALESAPWAVAAASAYAKINAQGTVRRVPAPPSGMLLQRLLVRNPFANGGHLLIRREAIDAAGLFAPSLRYGEDWEYWTRLALLGEFVSVRTPEPLLFVRERDGSAYRMMASDPSCFTPSMNLVYGNPALASRLGRRRLALLRRKSEAENAWVIGRELIRHLHPVEGRVWLSRSLRAAPGVRRLALLGLSWMGVGPFRPYEHNITAT